MLLLMSSAQTALALTAWQQVKQPVAGAPQAIGSPANGCIIGAEPLALDRSSYQVIRSQRLRYFGHPDLNNFISRLAAQTQAKNLGILLVGDMGMPAGGRFSSGHTSHQTGIDVDFWLQLPKQRWTDKQLKTPRAIDLVSANGKTVIDKQWRPELATLVKLAAQDRQVARIFVHPAIKQRLCETADQDKDWLMKVRPWFGHRSHMHVRLNCPTDSQQCIDQEPPPPGDGCGDELASWIADSEILPSAKPNNQTPPAPPALCQALLDNHFKVK